MIIDAHVHLPVGEEFPSLQAKKERLLQELKKNQVDRCIVISDSYMDSPIGTMEECVKLFEDCPEVTKDGKTVNYTFNSFSSTALSIKLFRLCLWFIA